VELLADLVPGYSLDVYDADLEEAVQCFAPKVSHYIFWKYMDSDLERFKALYDAFMKRWRQRRPALKLMPGIEKEIKEMCRGLDIGIAGQYGHEVLDLLKQHSLLGCFRYRFTQDDFPLTKPDPRYYEQILRACRLAPEACIMVGDRIDKDIVPAKQVGMKTIRVRTGIHKHQEPRIPFEVADCELAGVAGLAEVASSLAASQPETGRSD
jgi:8-oxo-dGTP diphosphatase/putative hydrolase of the HAD superfamily